MVASFRVARAGPGWWLAAAFVGAFGAAEPARADTGDVVMSEVLFRDGRDLLARKDYAHACPKLAESFRLDPATGTLLALAVCHERQGRLASAWGEYSDAASRSKVESRPDREAAARSKAAELEPKLSTLTIVLSEGAPAAGIEIHRDGVLVAPAWLGTAVPVDGGLVEIEASAPGSRHWKAQVVLAPSGDRQTVTIPPFENTWAVGGAPPSPLPPSPAPPRPPPPVASSTATPGTAAAPPPPEAPRPTAPRAVLSPLQWGGVAVGSLGLVGVGVGAALASVAAGKNNDSKALCSPSNPDLCSAQGRSDRQSAINAGNFATVGFIAGPALVATGLTLVLVGIRRERSTLDPAPSVSLEAIPMVGAQGVGGLLQGRF
jgi:hypothetical protein